MFAVLQYKEAVDTEKHAHKHTGAWRNWLFNCFIGELQPVSIFNIFNIYSTCTVFITL